MPTDQIEYGSIEHCRRLGHKITTAGFKRKDKTGPQGQPFYSVIWHHCCTCDRETERVGKWIW